MDAAVSALPAPVTIVAPYSRDGHGDHETLGRAAHSRSVGGGRTTVLRFPHLVLALGRPHRPCVAGVGVPPHPAGPDRQGTVERTIPRRSDRCRTGPETRRSLPAEFLTHFARSGDTFTVTRFRICRRPHRNRSGAGDERCPHRQGGLRSRAHRTTRPVGRCAPRPTRSPNATPSSPPCRRASSTTSSRSGRSIRRAQPCPHRGHRPRHHGRREFRTLAEGASPASRSTASTSSRHPAQDWPGRPLRRRCPHRDRLLPHTQAARADPRPDHGVDPRRLHSRPLPLDRGDRGLAARRRAGPRHLPRPLAGCPSSPTTMSATTGSTSSTSPRTVRVKEEA